ncbi:HupE/UreJ family protein [Saprospiraceae bacterium]|nr:HupE/UreJ family protein [Saprospiraceae bacterium]
MFYEFLKLGVSHILDINGVDHILFLVGLTIIYTIKDWKSVLWLATAFTIGHSVTLALAAIDMIQVNSNFIEILIALSIFIVAVSNVFIIRSSDASSMKWKYLSAGVFGLIHGIGFSNFFSVMLAGDSMTFPLLGFNIGVEIAQLMIVSGVLIVSHFIIKIIPRTPYIIAVSSIIAIWALYLIVERI